MDLQGFTTEVNSVHTQQSKSCPCTCHKGIHREWRQAGLDGLEVR